MTPVAAPGGTVAVMLLTLPLQQTLKGAGTPLNSTAFTVPGKVPKMKTLAPTPPEAGSNSEIVGGGGGGVPVVTVNAALVADPAELSTSIGPVTAPSGTVTTIVVGVRD